MPLLAGTGPNVRAISEIAAHNELDLPWWGLPILDVSGVHRRCSLEGETSRHLVGLCRFNARHSPERYGSGDFVAVAAPLEQYGSRYFVECGDRRGLRAMHWLFGWFACNVRPPAAAGALFQRWTRDQKGVRSRSTPVVYTQPRQKRCTLLRLRLQRWDL